MRILRDGGRTGTGMRLEQVHGRDGDRRSLRSPRRCSPAPDCMTRASVLSLQQDYGADVQRVHERARRPAAGDLSRRRSRASSSRNWSRSCAGEPGRAARPRRLRRCRARARTTGASPSRARRTTIAPTIPCAHTVTVRPGFFDAFHRPVLQGREFNASRPRGQPPRRDRERGVRARSTSRMATPLGARACTSAETSNAAAAHHRRRVAEHQSRQGLEGRRLRARRSTAR